MMVVYWIIAALMLVVFLPTVPIRRKRDVFYIIGGCLLWPVAMVGITAYLVGDMIRKWWRLPW